MSEDTTEQLPAEVPPVPPKKYKPQKIKPTDHAKFYVVKERGKQPFNLAQDKTENRKLWQLTNEAFKAVGKCIFMNVFPNNPKQYAGLVMRMMPQERK